MQKLSFLKNSNFLAIIACFLWSTAFAGIKLGLPYSPPLQFAGLRFVLAGLLILFFCKNVRHEFGLVLRNLRQVLTISLFQTFLLYTFFYLGMAKVPGAIGAIVVGAGPLFVAVLANYFTENNPLNGRKIIALLIGFSGIVLLALAKDNSLLNRQAVLWGILILVASNLFGSYGNILVSKNRMGISPLFLNSFQLFIGGVAILILSFFTEGFTFIPKPPAYYFSLAWLSIMAAVAFSLWFIVLSRPKVKVSEINVWKFIVPVFGAILSWGFIHGEQPKWYTLFGMCLIGLSVVTIYWNSKYKAALPGLKLTGQKENIK